MNNMKKYIYIFCAFCLLSSCTTDPTAGVIVPKYAPSTENPKEPDDKPEDGLIDPAEPLTRGLVHLKGRELKSLNAISMVGLSDEEKVTLSTLAGLAARVTGDQVYMNEGGPSSVWLKEMQNRYGIPVKTYNAIAPLIEHYVSTGVVKGYITYKPYTDGQSNSVNVATSLCGLLRGIAVAESLVDKVKAMGVSNELMNVTSRDEKWLYENYKDRLDKSLAADLKPEIFHHLRDYVSMTNAFAFYDYNAKNNWSWRSSILRDLDKGAYCFGYYDLDEWGMVNNASQLGVSMLPTDQAANMATLSSIYTTDGLKQRPATKEVTTEENVHYVTFLVSDGDNIAFNLWGMQGYFDDDLHGQFPVGYTISPSLYDLAPAALRWYYENSKQGDYFVAGPSGSSYIFPSKMPDNDLDSYLVKLNTYVDQSGLNICNILDQGIMDNPKVYNKYLAQSNIDAVFYTGYGEKGDGRIKFSDNGKPVIEQRSVLWEGIDGGSNRGEESTVISQINARPANPHTADGYTFVFVHCWTKDQKSIQTVVKGLNQNVRVVPADMFVQLVKQNLGMKK